ncbi:type VI secretion system-associated FHA domain protein TagH [Novosphingobium sp. Gsoil 351]|uniref:type VI secretion system-associated FHA domain protein TagH n=1 Tax=Novosphingobium sp. Gsoil 351 TaxID=2675225 RepID=UPI0012B4B3BE|nr:type VI secretion system-associated FHA domain protein TagH [Novosphingobium sp. Gsoil 351]QGN55433.1 type VI secretion system-associated FHA domain protein TagH [Novosphingobium sp. Gsoil 351]
MSVDRPLALTLQVRNMTQLANGGPLSVVLDRRSATIGRAGSTDWSLPDPELHISGRHCDILFRNGGYELVDNSTNGTFVNDDKRRLSGPHPLRDGDLIRIGKYEVVARLGPPPGAVPRDPTTPPVAVIPPTPVQAPPMPPGDDDIWNKFAASNSIDWKRGGFGAAAPAPPPAAWPDPVAASPVAASQPSPAPPSPAPAPAPAPLAQSEAPAAMAQAPAAELALEAFLAGAGVPPDTVQQDPAAALHQAGMLLRGLVAGMVMMLEARARAKSQMGAQGTGLEISGNNPLKFARNPDQALRHILNPAERGFMGADLAVEDGWRDLQAHQLATLKAMQGALRSTLERFSPKSIRSRAETRGMLEKILPGARDAALWKAYEREFSGVAFDSDEAFMDMFAKEFRKAYDDITRGG